jgi:hypothetical protein
LTSREFLYHLPCSSSARKLDSFWSGWLASETAVRTDRKGTISQVPSSTVRFSTLVEPRCEETVHHPALKSALSRAGGLAWPSREQVTR